jgi:hypothetical protein
MTFLRQISLLALAACMGLVLVGCQPSDPNSPRVAEFTAIAVTPNPVKLEIGGVQALTVTGSFSDGSSYVVSFGSTFASSAPAVARVDAATGYVTALAAGSATITATHAASGKTATTAVTVAPLRIMSVAVSPAPLALTVGATQALTVTATYNNATTGPVTAGSTFVSSNPTVATVDAAGIVTAVAEGSTTITAKHTASGQTAATVVTVSPAPTTDFPTITFDSTGVVYTLTGFGGAEDSKLAPDPVGGSNTVARVVKSATAESWAGTTVSTKANNTVPRIPFTATETKMTVRVYAPKAGIVVRLKVEDVADPARSVETEAVTTKANAWEALTFDFAKPVTGTAALNLAYTYNKISIFFAFGTTGAAGGAGTYHFDDVKFMGGGSSGNTGTCAAPSCTDFSAAGIGFGVFENPGGGTVELAKDPKDPANDVVKFVKKTGDNDFFGTTITGLAGPATLTATDKTVTLRVFTTAVGTNFLLKLEGGPGGAVVEKDAVTTLAGTWETLSFDLSGGAVGTYATVVIFPNGRSKVTADKTMYADELRFPATAGGGSGSTGTCTGAACVDFSEPGIGFAPFENQGGGTASIVDDPNDAANKVAKFVKKPGDGAFFGTPITGLGGSVVLTATDKTVTLRVFSPAVGTNFLLKFEGGTGGPATTEKDAVTTRAGQWETLSFVMPDAGTYTTVVIFPGGRSTVAADTTMYIDELRFPALNTGGGGTALVFASNYSQVNPSSWKSTEGGDAGTYIDTSVPTQYWWNGVAPGDATPNFYFGYGINVNAKPWGFGAYVSAPGNGTLAVTGKTNLQIAVWGNDELMNTRPTLTLILKGPSVGGCTPELLSKVSVAAPGVQKYTAPLGAFTLQTACGYGSAAAALAAGVSQVHVQVLGSNVQYVTGGPADFANGLNVGPISFD